MENIDDPMRSDSDRGRVVAQTKVGTNNKLVVSTVRTPMKSTYETCIFNDLTRQSSLVDYGIKGRSEALDGHFKWVLEVFENGFDFDKAGERHG